MCFIKLIAAVSLWRDFFYLLDYVTHRSEKLGYHRDFFGRGLWKSLRNYHFQTSLSFGELRKNVIIGCMYYFYFFIFFIFLFLFFVFAITDPKKFS